MHVIDLSVALEPVAGEPVPVELEFIDHRSGAEILGRPIGIGPDEFPDGLGLSLEYVRLTSHSGTHVDAPAHYGPSCAGARAPTIDELPLEQFFAPGVVLDCKGTVADGPVSSHELVRALAAIEYELRPGDIVLINTGAAARWNTPEYFTDFRGVTAEATEWLIDRGIRVIGVDSFGFDPPFDVMLRKFERARDSAELWPAHVLGRRRPYCQIERLGNLDVIPRKRGFHVACFPLKLARCGAAPSRVVAILD
jgi:kynurenine formamidase